MKTFGNNDIIMARATFMGQEIVNANFNGISSMSSLLRAIKQRIGNAIGLVTISVRNITQGWIQNQTYRFA